MNVKAVEHKMTILPNGLEVFFETLAIILQYGIPVAVVLFITASQGGFNSIIIYPLLVVAGWFLLALFSEKNAYKTTFDNQKQTIITTFRSAWTLWTPDRKEIPYKNLLGLYLSKSENTTLQLRLSLRGEGRVSFAGTASADCAEKLSGFLKIPLIVELDNQRITKMPWISNKEGTLFPTPCAKCGAPLPAIESGMYNVRCNHCGMTMVITWSEGRISYKAQG